MEIVLAKQKLTCKPGSVRSVRVPSVSAINLGGMSPYCSVTLEPRAFHPPAQAGSPLTPVYLNLQLPRHTAPVSPQAWWALAPPSHPYLAAVVFFCAAQPSPTASRWEVECPVLPGLSSARRGRRQTGQLSGRKIRFFIPFIQTHSCGFRIVGK